MTASDNLGSGIRRIIRALCWVIGGVTLAAGLFLLAVSRLDNPRSRKLIANEVSAISKIHTVVVLQDEYKVAHTYTGFACDLALLKSMGQPKFPDYSLEFLSKGMQSGYRFALASCVSDANQPTAHYQVFAVPVQNGTTGVRAFCADETGVIWYDLHGSATNCLASRRLLQ